MNPLKKYRRLLKDNTALGIDVFIHADGSYSYSFCNVKKTNNKVDIIKSLAGITDIQELVKHIEPDTPVYLAVNGKGIIHKKSEYTEDADDSYYVSNILPGDASQKDFYVQLSPLYGNALYVSIARKSMIDNVIKIFDEHYITVITCSLGPFILHHLLEGFNEESGSFYHLSLPHHSLDISNNQIIDYHSVKEEQPFSSAAMLVYGQELLPEFFISFALALQHFIKNVQIQISDPGLAERRATANQKRIFNLSYPAVALALLILSTSFFLLKHNLDNKKQKLLSAISSYQQDMQQYDTLTTTYNNKKEFIEKSGIHKLSRSTFFVDRLLENIPEGIQLTELTYCPAKRNASNDSLIQYKSNLFFIAGNCEHSAVLNDWMKSIKEKKMIGTVNLENYKQDKQSSKGEFLFTASINP